MGALLALAWLSLVCLPAGAHATPAPHTALPGAPLARLAGRRLGELAALSPMEAAQALHEKPIAFVPGQRQALAAVRLLIAVPSLHRSAVVRGLAEATIDPTNLLWTGIEAERLRAEASNDPTLRWALREARAMAVIEALAIDWELRQRSPAVARAVAEQPGSLWTKRVLWRREHGAPLPIDTLSDAQLVEAAKLAERSFERNQQQLLLHREFRDAAALATTPADLDPAYRTLIEEIHRRPAALGLYLWQEPPEGLHH